MTTAAKRYPSSATLEAVLDDIFSLVARYSPHDLRRVDYMVSSAPCLRDVHRMLRQQLAPHVMSTVYVAVHDVTLTDRAVEQERFLSVTVGDSTVSDAPRGRVVLTPEVYSGHRQSTLRHLLVPPIRVDICYPSSGSTNAPAGLAAVEVGRGRGSLSTTEALVRGGGANVHRLTHVRGNKAGWSSHSTVALDMSQSTGLRTMNSSHVHVDAGASGSHHGVQLNALVPHLNHDDQRGNHTPVSHTTATVSKKKNTHGSDGVANRDCHHAASYPIHHETVMTLYVRDRAHLASSTHLGKVSVSLLALLTPNVYTIPERVTVPLMHIETEHNVVQVCCVGSITFSVFVPMYELQNPILRLPPTASHHFDKNYVRYYTERITRFLRHYDPNSLFLLHNVIYEVFVAQGTWRTELPAYLSKLIKLWGSEKWAVEPPPPPDGGGVGVQARTSHTAATVVARARRDRVVGGTPAAVSTTARRDAADVRASNTPVSCVSNKSFRRAESIDHSETVHSRV